MPIYKALEERYPSIINRTALYQAAYEQLKFLPGDLAEFGVSNGGGARQLSKIAPDRQVWAFDTYNQMMEDAYAIHHENAPPQSTIESDALFEGLTNIKVVKGRFADTLPTVPAKVRFLICHIDCAYFNAYKQVLDFLADGHLQLGSVLFFDDWHCPEATQAVTEWIVQHPSTEFVYSTKIIWHG